MTRRGVMYLVLAALALTAASFALSRRDSADWRANQSRLLLPFPWKDTVAVTVRQTDGDALEFFRKPGEEWQIRLGDDFSDTLNLAAVDSLAALATLAWREPLAEGKMPARDKCIVMIAESATGQGVRLDFVETVGTLRAVTVDGDTSVVYGISSDLVKFLDWPGDRFRNMHLAGLPGARPVRVAVSPKGDSDESRLVMERQPGGWRLVSPIDWPVDESRLELLLQWLERLRAISIEAEQPADLEWFGFASDSASIEAVYETPSGQVKRRVQFGRTARDGMMYAKVDGRTPVFGMQERTLREIFLDIAGEFPEQWKDYYRQRSVNVIGDGLPEALTVERLLPKPEKLILEPVSGPDGVPIRWRGILERGGKIEEFAVDPPSSAEAMRPLTALMAGLSSLRVENFLADSRPGPETLAWTAFPAWRFSSRREDGTRNPVLTLYAADATGELPAGSPYEEGVAAPAEMKSLPGHPQSVGIVFSADDSQAVMEMPAEFGYLLCLPLYRYRSARVLNEDSRSWSRVELIRDEGTAVFTRDETGLNEQWWRETAGGREPLMDDNNLFVNLLLRLSQLRAGGYVAETADPSGQFGLDHPEISAIVYVSPQGGEPESDSNRLFALDIGRASGGGDTGCRYARLNGEGPIFLVPDVLTDSLRGTFR